jgi:hypothetical protein
MDGARSSSQGFGVTVLAILALSSFPAATSAQVGDRGFTLGLDGGVFIDYPSQFNEPFCEQRAAAFSGKGSYWLTQYLGLEGSLTGTVGIGDESCYYPLSPAPLPGTEFTVPVRDEVLIGTSFSAINLAATLEAPIEFPVRPRARVGAGWIWNKEMPTWFVGGGFRYQFGAHALIMDVERWSMNFEIAEQTFVEEPVGELQLLYENVIEQEMAPYLVRVGWEVSIR